MSNTLEADPVAKPPADQRLESLVAGLTLSQAQHLHKTLGEALAAWEQEPCSCGLCPSGRLA